MTMPPHPVAQAQNVARNAAEDSGKRRGLHDAVRDDEDVLAARLGHVAVHIDVAEVQTAGRKLFLFGRIDQTSKFVDAQLVVTADRKTAGGVLQHMLEAVPYQFLAIVRKMRPRKYSNIFWDLRFTITVSPEKIPPAKG